MASRLLCCCAIQFAILLFSLQEISTAPVIHAYNATTAQDGCKLIVNIKQMFPNDFEMGRVDMPSLVELLRDQINGKIPQYTKCNLTIVLQPSITLSGPDTSTITTTTTARAITTAATPSPPPPPPTTTTTTTAKPFITDNSYSYNTKPIYEMQLAVWPQIIDDISDIVPTNDEDTIIPYPEEELNDSGLPSSNPNNPIYEDQFVVYPQSDVKPSTGHNSDQNIKVIEQFQFLHPNGTREYKLVLSNGVVNYKKLFTKIVDGKQVPAQEGFDSIPIPGQKNKFQTQYYTSDEKGHMVRVEQEYRQPMA